MMFEAAKVYNAFLFIIFSESKHTLAFFIPHRFEHTGNPDERKIEEYDFYKGKIETDK